MADNQLKFIQWVQRQAANAPVSERIMVYRELAVIAGDESEAKQFTKMADQFEAAERHSMEVQFQMDLKGGRS